jgi:hypothetical protein
MGRTLLLLSLGGILVGACVWSGWVWMSLGNAEISTHGMIALTLGIVVSVAVGVGLMALVFFSSRRGFDDQVTYDFGETDELP